MKALFIYGRTTHCCVCKGLATNWNGWLRKSRDGVIAGFCDEHKPENDNFDGTYGIHNYRGLFDKTMGFTENQMKEVKP